MKEMLELAEQAVEAARFWNIELDYSAESLEPLEKMMQAVFRSHKNVPLPVDMLFNVANMYGAYLGEVLLRSGLEDLGFAWMTNDEGEAGIGRKDMKIWPVTKVYKRITQGPEHDLMNFFEVMFGLAIGAVDLADPRMHVLNQKAV